MRFLSMLIKNLKTKKLLTKSVLVSNFLFEKIPFNSPHFA